MEVEQQGQQAGEALSQRQKREQWGAEATVEKQVCWAGVGRLVSGRLAQAGGGRLSMKEHRLTRRCVGERGQGGTPLSGGRLESWQSVVP